MSAENVLLICLAAFAATFVIVAISNVAFYIRLKRYEHDTWLSLGSPMPGVNLNTFNFASVRRFLKSQGHQSLHDKRSARLGDLVVLSDRIFLGVILSVSLVTGYIVFFVQP